MTDVVENEVIVGVVYYDILNILRPFIECCKSLTIDVILLIYKLLFMMIFYFLKFYVLKDLFYY